ncbi:tight adherence protein C [Geodermatophilus telluris]|uniref:Tight adherence protein C n=1 Tax=Geodermatophilus telluris TaxID=1190417 RepID=A0A1G6SH93_9ACTN|nr:type II secretion system F family protein [Geodermatophilus telluris]SDD16024.1 tight adherence protein C [Geodermatophilus telluris]
MSAVPVPVLAAALAVALAVPLLGWALLARPDAATVQARDNLTRGLDAAPVGAAVPVGGGAAGRLVRALTPPGTVARVDRLLGTAGRPAEWPLARVLTVKLVLPAIAAALGVLLLSARPGALLAVLVVAVTVVCWFVPELLLTSRGQERRQAIELELADTLDQMTIAVEAGLGFESALARAGRTGKGPLAEELVRTLQDIGVGQPRREAYLALAERTGVADLRRFIRAVVQADVYGVSIADVLRTQAAEMRLKRRQRAEEKAMQIPVKVIFPLILCILPTLFIVLLGPAAMDIAATFSGD